jgi:hypothetical protein
MWPLTLSLPRYPETFVVVLVDKFFCIREAFKSGNHKVMNKICEAAY